MTTLDNADSKPAPWHDRLSDWFNAILIKESRQSLKSRQFVVTFFLMLGISWVVSVFYLLTSGSDLEFGTVGSSLFRSFYAVLALAAVVIIPFSAFRSLLSERDLNTFELLSITTLSPRQIVWGKLLSAGLQLFLFYSAITPFMAFASLLQGFNSAVAGFILVSTMLLSLFLSMGALMMSAFARHRVLAGLITVAVLFGLVATFIFLWLRVIVMVRTEVIQILDPEFWWITALELLAGVSYFILFQQITVAQLTFDADNRSTGVRIVCAAQFWLLWGSFAAFYYFRSAVPSSLTLQVLAGLAAAHWTIAGMVFATEADSLSRRVRRGVSGNRLLRILSAPFLPGGSRGLCLALLHFAALWGIVALVQGLDGMRPGGLTFAEYCRDLWDPLSASWTPTLRFTAVVCLYGAVFVGIAAALGRWGRQVSEDIAAAHVRVIVILIFTAGLIFPLVLRATEVVKRQDYSVFDITSSAMTCRYVVSKTALPPVAFDWSLPTGSLDELVKARGYVDVIVVLLAAAAIVAFAVNLPSLYRGVFRLRPLRRRSPGADAFSQTPQPSPTPAAAPAPASPP